MFSLVPAAVHGLSLVGLARKGRERRREEEKHLPKKKTGKKKIQGYLQGGGKLAFKVATLVDLTLNAC